MMMNKPNTRSAERLFAKIVAAVLTLALVAPCEVGAAVTSAPTATPKPAPVPNSKLTTAQLLKKYNIVPYKGWLATQQKITDVAPTLVIVLNTQPEKVSEKLYKLQWEYLRSGYAATGYIMDVAEGDYYYFEGKGIPTEFEGVIERIQQIGVLSAVHTLAEEEAYIARGGVTKTDHCEAVLNFIARYYPDESSRPRWRQVCLLGMEVFDEGAQVGLPGATPNGIMLDYVVCESTTQSFTITGPGSYFYVPHGAGHRAESLAGQQGWHWETDPTFVRANGVVHSVTQADVDAYTTALKIAPVTPQSTVYYHPEDAPARTLQDPQGGANGTYDYRLLDGLLASGLGQNFRPFLSNYLQPYTQAAGITLSNDELGALVSQLGFGLLLSEDHTFAIINRLNQAYDTYSLQAEFEFQHYRLPSDPAKRKETLNKARMGDLSYEQCEALFLEKVKAAYKKVPIKWFFMGEHNFDIPAYNISGHFYVRPRDLAAVLTGYVQYFGVEERDGMIRIGLDNVPYRPNGNELKTPKSIATTAVPSKTKIDYTVVLRPCNGEAVYKYTIYDINGEDWVKLNWFMDMLGIGITYKDGKLEIKW